jgi:protein dithiol oxidoreductase (disulfide-forming)
MRFVHWSLATLLLTCLAADVVAQPQPGWKQGEHYFLLPRAQPTNVPAGKVEVTEVFSYACPACNQFNPVLEQIKASLPANVQVDYVPASFNTAEQWPLFQRAFFAAQTLGIAEKTHAAMYDAIWKTGELAIVDTRTGQLRNPPPTLADVAAFYQRTAGVKKEDFLATANSFGVEVKIKRADALWKAYQADSTPTLIVNGKYRLTPSSAGGYNQVSALLKYLVAQESKS